MFSFLQYDFFIRALEAGLILALVAPTIGIFFVVRRYSSLADTLAHVSLAGIAAGLFFGVSSIVSALVASVIAILGIEKLRSDRTLSSDTIVSLFLFGGLALGVVLIGLHPGGGINISSLLFGSVLTVSDLAIKQIAIIGGAIFIITLLLWKQFFAISLDEDVARTSGLKVGLLNRVLAILGASVIAISINIVGVLLIGALMVIPVLSGMQLRVGFRATWIVAVLISILSVILGLVSSYFLNLASGASIVLCTVLFFIIAWIFGKIANQ